MKVLLIDADSKIPNLALMKLGRWWKNRGARVDLVRLEIPYYPWRRREVVGFDFSGYDKLYCSVVFSGSVNFVVGRGIEFGGSGYNLKLGLGSEVEACEPDYGFYPNNKYSYGFLTRGCIRRCSFCIVPEKEGMIRQVAGVGDIVRHRLVRFLDNNIFAFPGHYRLLEELVDFGTRCTFYQGLDIRLVDDENAELLRRMNYIQPYRFAFDNWVDVGLVERGLGKLRWRRDWNVRFYVYCNADWALGDVFRRLEWLRERKCLPYLMRDLNCWASRERKFYIYLNKWANVPGIFKRFGFVDAIRNCFKELGDAERSHFIDLYFRALS